MSTTRAHPKYGAATVVLAAGLGTRMRSERAKVLHELAGEAMIVRVLRKLGTSTARSPIVVVVGRDAAEVERTVRAAFPGDDITFALQAEQRGTGHAACAGMAALPGDFDGEVLILYGDMPLVSEETLREFRNEIRAGDAVLGLISVELEDPGNYGRVLRDPSGAIERIVEARDATPAELSIGEINTGVYYARSAQRLREWLGEIGAANAQGEYYLTDIAAIARAHGHRATAWRARNAFEFSGVNSREEMAAMEAQIREQVNKRLMAAGVTLIDPNTAYISDQAEIGADTIIGPNVQILGRSRIGRGVRIEGTCWLKGVTVGDRCRIKLGVRAEDSVIGDDSEIGPFAHLRPGTELEGRNRIGNFVETKKAKFGRGSKASHLSYLGDAAIGRDTNVGCGVITVNYDGYDKHVTWIGDRCMVGCDTQLIAPVRVGDDVYVASGTTIVRDVEDGALVVSHHPQRERPGWTAEFHKRHEGRPPWWTEKH